MREWKKANEVKEGFIDFPLVKGKKQKKDRDLRSLGEIYLLKNY